MSESDKKREATLARIRALMAKTTANGCTEAEAQAAAAAVDRLIGEYEIDLDELVVREQEITKVDIAVSGHPVRHVCRRIAEFTDCKVWTDGKFVAYLGFQVDTEIAEYLTLTFMRSLDRESSGYTMFNADYALTDRAGQSQMLHSFQVDMAARLGERLLELKSKRDFTQRTTGRDLVKIKKPHIDEAFATLGITLGRSGGGRSVRHAGAYNACRTAADKVGINAGVRGYGAQSTGRIR